MAFPNEAEFRNYCKQKKKLANYIIDNSGDLENLQKEVEKYLQDYIPKVLEEN